MKQSKRILSLVMSVIMALTACSVAASAVGYTGSDLTKYDDVDKPAFTLDQYASMALDEVDRMLAEEQLVVDVFVGTLDVSSIDVALSSLTELWGKIQGLLTVLGDVKDLKLDALSGVSRADGDQTVIRALLNFIAQNAPIFEKYARGTLNVGAVQTYVAPYIFVMKDLAIGMIYEATDLWEDDIATLRSEGLLNDEGEYSFMDCYQIPSKYQVENGLIKVANDVVTKLLFGKWEKLDKFFDDANPLPYDYTYSMYDFKDTNGNSVSDQAVDIANYDYYGYVMYHNDEIRNSMTVSLAGAVRVNEGAAAPAAVNDLLDLTKPSDFYSMLENVLVRAYNYIAVPLLNNTLVQKLREKCGVEYKKEKLDKMTYNETTEKWVKNPSYVPGYTGEAFDLATLQQSSNLAKIFELEQVVTARKLSSAKLNAQVGQDGVTEGTVVENLNNILGDIITGGTRVSNGTSAPLIVSSFDAYDEDTDKTYQCTWNWNYGDNSKLFANVASVARFVLACTGSDFFSSVVKVKGPSELYGDDALGIDKLTDQQLVAYLLTCIINSSVDFLNIPDVDDENSDEAAEVVYQLVEGYALKYLPGIDYVKPERAANDTTETYYRKLVDKILAMLVDIMANNLNQTTDTVFTNSTTPGISPIGQSGEYNPDDSTKTGLLSFVENGSYEDTIVKLGVWAVSKYGGIVSTDSVGGALNCSTNYSTNGVTADKVFEDVDSLINAIIPIKSGNPSHGNRDDRPWVTASLASEDLVVKTLLVDWLILPVLQLDVTKISDFFIRNKAGALNDTLEKLLVDTIHRVFDVIFPGVFPDISTLDAFVSTDNIAYFVGDLLKSLGTLTYTSSNNSGTINGRGQALIELALPIVCSILDLDSEQEFGELESYLPSAIPATVYNETSEQYEPATTFKYSVFNASRGVNTSYRNKNDSYKRVQDKIYKYSITGISASVTNGTGSNPAISGLAPGDELSASKMKTITLSNFNAGDILKVIISYKVYDENGVAFKNENGSDRVLTNIGYTYVGNVSQDDSDILTAENLGNNYALQYNVAMYLNDGKGLSALTNYSIRVKNGNDAETTARVTNVEMTSAPSGWSTSKPLATLNTDTVTKDAQGNITGTHGVNAYVSKGTSVIYPFNAADIERLADIYQKDADGNFVLDDEGNKIVIGNNNGAPNGKYTFKITVQVGSTSKVIYLYLHLYNDHGLVSLTKDAIARNYSTADYDTTDNAAQSAYTAYNNALMAAAAVALRPKTTDSFESDYANSENLVNALKDADEAFTVYRQAFSADVVSLWNRIDQLSGHSYSIQKADGKNYYEQVGDYKYYQWRGEGCLDDMTVLSRTSGYYNYFSKNDFVYHTYKAYNNVKGDAEGLIKKGMLIFEMPRIENYDSVEQYNSAVADINACAEEWTPAIASNVEVSYLMNKLTLAYNRMIPIAPVFTKLSAAIAKCVPDDNITYSPESQENFDRALQFARELIKVGTTTYTDRNGNTLYYVTPSMVFTATEELIYAFKHLETAADYTRLDIVYMNSYDDADKGYGINATGVISNDEYGIDLDSLVGEFGAITDFYPSYDVYVAREEDPETYAEVLAYAEEIKDGIRANLTENDVGDISSLYTPFVNYINALKAVDYLYYEKEGGNPLGKSDQGRIDSACQTLINSFEALKSAFANVKVGGGGDQPGEEPTVVINPAASFSTPGGSECAPAINAGKTPDGDDFISVCEIAPTVTEGKFAGEEISGILTGIGDVQDFDENTVKSLFVCENCSVEVIPNSEGYYSSGAQVLIVSDKGTLVDAYLIILVGDCDGNAQVDTDDYAAIIADLRAQSWISTDGLQWANLAADTNADGQYDSDDASLITASIRGTYDIGQNPRGML
ncbi:MAG: hypothetical protein K6B52_04090 [Clostridiales bacterium]|nr:hypothetical protein [Clostridiales bacterium]